MRIHVVTATVATLVTSLALTAAAQSPKVVTPQPPNAPPPATNTTLRAQHASGAMKLSGCLQSAKEQAGYVVDGVKLTPSKHASKVHVSTKYEVRGLSDAELEPHVNQRVELTGQIAQTTSGASSVFLATSVKMLATACSSQ